MREVTGMRKATRIELRGDMLVNDGNKRGLRNVTGGRREVSEGRKEVENKRKLRGEGSTERRKKKEEKEMEGGGRRKI